MRESREEGPWEGTFQLDILYEEGLLGESLEDEKAYALPQITITV